jgi:peptidoglycan hydrolase-like protein with peptidoglycan-binding domain
MHRNPSVHLTEQTTEHTERGARMRARPSVVPAQADPGPRRRVMRHGVPVLGFAALVAVAGCGSSDSTAGMPFDPSTPTTSSPAVPPTSPAATPSVPSSATPSADPSPSASPSVTPSPSHVGLRQGDKGPEVLALQKKLQSMGFWLSAADGTYGQTTEQAVMAFQKATGLDRDGVAGPITLKAIKTATLTLKPQSTSGHVFEIDKTRQLLYIVDNGTIRSIFNTSTGSNQPYVQGGVTYTATTPSGQFSVFRQVDALDPGPLGDLWRPKYFNGGIAVHGSPSIPGYPASHGCARLSNPAIDWIWSNNQLPIGTSVWVY